MGSIERRKSTEGKSTAKVSAEEIRSRTTEDAKGKKK